MLRVIGVGNDQRGDDAAGLVLVRRLRARGGVSAIECPADPSALLDAWLGEGRVVVVDAMQSGAAPGTVARFDALAEPLPAATFRGSTHGLGVAEAVELGRALGLLPGSLVVYAIEGASWDAGAPLTAAVERGLERLLARLAHDEGIA